MLIHFPFNGGFIGFQILNQHVKVFAALQGGGFAGFYTNPNLEIAEVVEFGMVGAPVHHLYSIGW